MMEYEVQRYIKVAFEHCNDCQFLKVEENKIMYSGEKPIEYITVCAYRDICENAIKIWNKGKRKKNG